MLGQRIAFAPQADLEAGELTARIGAELRRVAGIGFLRQRDTPPIDI
jgi:hypothetical protein